MIHRNKKDEKKIEEIRTQFNQPHNLASTYLEVHLFK